MNARLVAFLVAALLLAGCGGGSDRSDAIAAKIGANGCVQETYEIQNRLDGSKERIYDCDLNAQSTCVVEEGGIAKDVTAEVRLLFSSSLGGQRPDCLGQ